jgi:hypothetical protein
MAEILGSGLALTGSSFGDPNVSTWEIQHWEAPEN